MRIYNGKNAGINLPLPNGERLTIDPKSVSKDFMPSLELLNKIKVSFDYTEIALIVASITEMNMCSSISCMAGFVVNSVSEAVERFSPKKVETPAPVEIQNPAYLTPDKEEKIEEEVKKLDEEKEKEKEKTHSKKKKA